jgi:3',5'-cyclic AMP phosphodiesterase CpdA
LISFGQVTDTHITLDGFSLITNPVLETLLDSFGDTIGFGGLDRPDPQERFDVDVLRAIMQTMNAITSSSPLDLIMHTGDAPDIGVMEELVAFLSIMNQSNVPWFQTVGNHDIFALGIFPANVAETLSALTFLTVEEFIAEHFNRGHLPTFTAYGSQSMGFDFSPGFNGTPASVKGFYAFSPVSPMRDASNTLIQPGIRFYVLESTSREGGASGTAEDTQISWLSEELDQHSDSLGIVVSHHPLSDLVIGRDDLADVLFDHPQVIAVLSGHQHRHLITAYPDTRQPEHGFWQIQTSSLIDFPQQARILEVLNNGDGTGSIRTFVFNQQAGGGLGENARASYASAAQERFDGSGSEGDRNVELLFQFPSLSL